MIGKLFVKIFFCGKIWTYNMYILYGDFRKPMISGKYFLFYPQKIHFFRQMIGQFLDKINQKNPSRRPQICPEGQWKFLPCHMFFVVDQPSSCIPVLAFAWQRIDHQPVVILSIQSVLEPKAILEKTKLIMAEPRSPSKKWSWEWSETSEHLSISQFLAPCEFSLHTRNLSHSTLKRG